MIEDLTKLYQQLQNVQELGNRTMEEDEPIIEVSREWWEKMMAAVHDAIDLLGPTEAEESDAEFIDRMIRENSVHAQPDAR
jgi:hypothetical protein